MYYMHIIHVHMYFSRNFRFLHPLAKIQGNTQVIINVYMNNREKYHTL